MHIWLIQVGEPLPLDPGAPRLYRTGQMARVLRARGHTMDWFAADFNHFTKTSRGRPDQMVAVEEGYRIHLLASPGYKKNVSVARLRDHAMLLRSFRKAMRTAPRPDLILASYPTIELAAASVAHGDAEGIPVILDVRDLWPESFLDAFPQVLHSVLRPFLYPFYRKAAACFRGADRIIANTDSMVRWARGVAHVPLREGDGGVHLAYPDTAPPAGVADAEAAWDARGVTRERWSRIACFFGTFNPRYLDLETVIRACARDTVRQAGIACVLCGDGEGMAACRALAAGVPNVYLPGWVEAPEIYTLLRRSDVGLAPYRNCLNFCSSIPNKPPEYLSASLPVVSSLDGELRALLERGGCGVHYDAGDDGALAAILLSMARDPAPWRERSVRAGRLYQEEFRIDVVYGGFADQLAHMHARMTPGADAP